MDRQKDLHYWVFQALFIQSFLFHAAEEWDAPLEVGLTMGLLGLFIAVERLRDWVFLAFVTLLALRNIEKFPGLANHSNIFLFVCLFLLPLQLRRTLRREDGPVASTLLTLRWVVLVMYFFTGFHKLNTDFFDPSVSCSYRKMDDYLEVLSLDVDALPVWLAQFVPLGVVLMELLPPLLFLWGRAQKYGVAMLLMIHGLLAPVGFADFSSLGMALLWLFVPPEAIPEDRARAYFRTLAGAFIVMQLILGIWRLPIQDEVFQNVEGALLVVGFIPVWATYFLSGRPGPKMPLPPRWPERGFVAFLIFFAMNNYLGLRTAGTLSMFSNLVTEGERSNHFLFGSNPIKVFGFQDDSVLILDVDPRVEGAFRRSLYPEHRVVRIEFDRILQRIRRRNFSKLYMTVEYQGREYATEDLARDPDFGFPVPWWQKKLMKFRVIQSERPQRCAW